MTFQGQTALIYFLPIFAFLLVFIVIYAILKKTKVLGDNDAVMLFISFILSSFFVTETSLVDFVTFSSAWFVVLVVVVFFITLLLAFLPGDKPLDFMTKGNWFSWVILGVLVALFIISSAYIFHWTINWARLKSWASSEWFGMFLLLVIAAIVSWKIKQD